MYWLCERVSDASFPNRENVSLQLFNHRLEINSKECLMLRRFGTASLIIVVVVALAAVALGHEKVKLTGYVVDVMCSASHVKDAPEDATKFAAEHSKECGLMEDCIKSGYGIFSDGKWYPFDEKGNALAKAIFEKTAKKDNIKVTVEGMKHDGKILVQSITETD
jgi:hypothetical protein